MTRLEAFSNVVTVWIIVFVFQLIILFLTGNYKPIMYVMGGFTVVIGILAFIQDRQLIKNSEKYDFENFDDLEEEDD